MRNLFKSILMRFRLLLFNGRPLIIFELLFNVLSSFAISPLFFQIFRFAMKATNYNFVDQNNFLLFLSHPLTILLIIILILLIALISLIDISAAIFVFECSRQNKKTSVKEIIIFAFKNSIRVLLPKNFLLIFVVLVILPLVNIGVGSNFIGRYSIPINFKDLIIYNPWIILFTVAILGVLLFLAMKWVFAIHYFTLEKVDFTTAIKKSWNLLRGNTIRNFISIMVVQILIALLTKLLNIIGSFFVHAIGQTFGTHTLLGCFGITIAAIAFLIIYLILFALFLPYSCLKVSALFYDRKEASKEPIVNTVCKNIITTKKTKKKMIITFATIIVLAILLGTSVLFLGQNTDAQVKTKEVIANRKTLLDSTENTLGSIKSAAELGSSAIEVDVQISADNIAYLGREKSNKNFKEISQESIRAFTKNGIVTDNIPSLNEAINCAKENNINLILDVSETADLNTILATILNSEDICSISSNNYDNIHQVKKTNPKISTLFKIGSAIGDFSGFDKADAIGLDLWVVDNTTVNDIHSTNKKVFALEVNTKDKIEKALDTKIDGLSTTQVKPAIELNSTNGMPEFMYPFVEFYS